MKLYDLNNDKVYTFLHTDYERALYVTYAICNNYLNLYVNNYHQLKKIAGNIKTGYHGYHLHNYSIPFKSIKD